MQIEEIRRIVKIAGTTSGASNTVGIGSFDFATIGQGDGDPGSCIVKCRAHLVLHDTTNGQVRAVDFDLCWLDSAGSVSLQVAGSPSYTIVMPLGGTWTFAFGISATLMSATMTSPGGASGITAIAGGWLDLDVHY